ncbi:hypothetical protein MPSEU_000457100 [Mayamaea pseudoterrestris]|nr:hypothetical protein MPSEU_000457100 [Mayamaea pseudoterrestris]
MASTCSSTLDLSLALVGAGVSLLAVCLVQASVSCGYPLHQLGVRPRGSGLWSYLYNHLVHGQGVKGYDPVQGALSPPLRLGVHLSCCFFVWAILLAAWPMLHIPDACLGGFGLTLSFWQSALVAVTTYSFSCHVICNYLPGVSHPGGARQHKMQRKPRWNNIESKLPSDSKWRFSSAHESHQVTMDRFADTEARLTGEPVGRNVWTTAPPKQQQSSHHDVDERLVQELAAGGRPVGSFNPSINPNSCDMPFRAQMIRNYIRAGKTPPSITSQPKTIKDVLRKAVHFYSMLQTEDGHWSGDYGGPLFLTPGFVIAWYIMKKPSLMFDVDEIDMLTHYMLVHQQEDGGWGTHIESPSTMFGTTLNYVALRLMGVGADEPSTRKARAFLLRHGGAIMTSSWAKLYLCMLGCMHWDGHNSVPPEIWLLPEWFPFHPSRMWCHARMVYLPMGYVYGTRLIYSDAETDPVILSLRKELYCEDYEQIQWSKTRHLVAPMDNYSPINPIMATVQNILARYESWPIFRPFRDDVRRRGLAFCVDYMAAEDQQTNYIDIGPVNKVLNMISAYHATGGDAHHVTLLNHFARVSDYLWLAEDGLRVKGYSGSQCWDTSFAIQSIYEAKLLDEFPDVSRRVWSFLERTQILSTETSQNTLAYAFESPENRKKYYRHVSKGGWPFSTSAHGWPIADCTGEGLKGVLCLLRSKSVQDSIASGELKHIDEERLQNAINVLLSYQNEDGGWATYENNRGFGWYEALNPSEVFGDIMIDYSYVELSMASLTALVEFREVYPVHRCDEINSAVERGRSFLKSIQRDDGSWYGSWACCFCYGVWFGVEGLIKAGEPRSSKCIQNACKFLLRHQRPNGGWGEDFSSCYNKDYAINGMEDYGNEGSGVVNTAWALLALSIARYDNVEAVKRGIDYLVKRQLPSGDWPQEGIAGVFNRACGISYTAYRNVFPIWAIGRCVEEYGNAIDG